MSEETPHHQIARPAQRASARRMRRTPTDAEKKFWWLLRDRRLGGLKFRRQVPLGRYVFDFVCFGAKLVVEADGGQHAGSCHDVDRDAWLAQQGFQVVRYWNTDILGNPDGVLEDLVARLAVPSPLAGEGGRAAAG
jgi:very-short-patch-repair endonuclease